MERELLMPKLVMRGIRLSGNEHAVLFCSAGVPPRGSIDGSHVVELDNGLLASRRSSDQPPSALKGSDLYQSAVYSTNEIVWLVLFLRVSVLPSLLSAGIDTTTHILLVTAMSSDIALCEQIIT